MRPARSGGRSGLNGNTLLTNADGQAGSGELASEGEARREAGHGRETHFCSEWV